MGRIDEGIELAAQVITLNRRPCLPPATSSGISISPGGSKSEAEYQRSQTLDGSHADPNFLVLLRGLARQDADPRALREMFQRAWPEHEKPPQWWHDFGAAIPNRQGMLAVLRTSVEAGAPSRKRVEP
jgi:hypothetical protein